MWFAHFTLPLLVYLIVPQLSLPCLTFGSLIPYFDLIPIALKFKDRTFHESVIHTPFVVLLFSLPLVLLSTDMFISSMIGGLLHILCDGGSNHGILIFYPLSNWSLAFNLWTDTGFASEGYEGIFQDLCHYISQKVPLFLEILIVLLVVLVYAIS